MKIPDVAATYDLERRFGGVVRLIGEPDFKRLTKAHIAIAGIGGVGSWVAEALARSGIGRMTLIDLDHISESNTNRQIHALEEDFGRSKVAAMAQRIRAINPVCEVIEVDDFVSADNLATVFPLGIDMIVDCTDQLSAKLAMILYAHKLRIPLLVCGGAGGKTNPLKLQVADLAVSVNDPLLAKLRYQLRRYHGYAKEGKKMGVRVIFINQQMRPIKLCGPSEQKQSTSQPMQGLSCAGYGSIVTVTAAMGMLMAHEVVQIVCSARIRN